MDMPRVCWWDGTTGGAGGDEGLLLLWAGLA